MLCVVMGVTGNGKSTLGALLAHRLGIPFYDADDFHPPANRAKLQADIPLTDDDRWPWLESLAGHMADWQRTGDAVFACSALKKSYRDVLRRSGPVQFIHLLGTPEQFAERLEKRRMIGHALVKDYHHILESQFRDLEPPHNAIEIPFELTPEQAVELILKSLSKLHLEAEK